MVQQAFAALKAIPTEVGAVEAEVQGHIATLQSDMKGRVAGVRAQCDAGIAAIGGQRSAGDARLTSIEAETEARHAGLLAQLEAKRAASPDAVGALEGRLKTARERRAAAIDQARGGLDAVFLPLEAQVGRATEALDATDQVNLWIDEALGGKLTDLSGLRLQVTERIESLERSLQEPLDQVLARMTDLRVESTATLDAFTPKLETTRASLVELSDGSKKTIISALEAFEGPASSGAEGLLEQVAKMRERLAAISAQLREIATAASEGLALLVAQADAAAAKIREAMELVFGGVETTLDAIQQALDELQSAISIPLAELENLLAQLTDLVRDRHVHPRGLQGHGRGHPRRDPGHWAPGGARPERDLVDHAGRLDALVPDRDRGLDRGGPAPEPLDPARGSGRRRQGPAVDAGHDLP